MAEAIVDEVQAALDALAQRHIALDTTSLLRRADGIAALKGAHKTRTLATITSARCSNGTMARLSFLGSTSRASRPPLAQRRERIARRCA